MKIAYFDCFSGISGDMILGALADLGNDFSFIKKELKKLDLKGYSLSHKKVKRGVIETTRVDVKVTEKSSSKRNLKSIISIIKNSGLAEKIKNDSIKIFRRLAEAEATVHGTTINKVHFHEVGAIDSIVDIVGSVIGIHHLNISKIVSSSINIGSGFVKCDHGTLPVPAPAVVEMLRGVPCFSSGIRQELTTPTGAAVIVTLANEFGSLPELKTDRVGYGAGGKNLKEMPNALRIILGELSIANELKKEIFVLETNIDDMNPEFYDVVMEKLFQAGAVDVFLTPIIMKKNRPATKLSVLTQQQNVEMLANEVLKNTTSFGIRFYPVERVMLEREFQEIETVLGKVKVKIGKRDGEICHISPEYEHCKKISREQGIPIKKVYEEIQSAICKIFKV
ncbi:MAG: TIGR00299 family protein [Nitrospinae bacterium]|nr:TIGR00299 family protein [Nitrospinota bacterium]MDP7556101.1 nickel pincer cofactor biosynthesis protein LarC [Nitrospinota bacterium]